MSSPSSGSTSTSKIAGGIAGELDVEDAAEDHLAADGERRDGPGDEAADPSVWAVKSGRARRDQAGDRARDRPT